MDTSAASVWDGGSIVAVSEGKGVVAAMDDEDQAAACLPRNLGCMVVLSNDFGRVR